MDHIEDGFVIVSYDRASGDLYSGPDNLHDISDIVDNLSNELWPINKKIHDNPELGYKEFTAHDVLTSYMESKPGWNVKRSVYHLRTAWTAVFDSGKSGPVVSFNIEMDALPEIGHACGHNLIATASLAGGLAAAELMKQSSLEGKIVMFGTPAEEGGGGKIRLLKAGAYKDHGVDISLISHPGIVSDSALVRTTAYTRFKASYTGREAHAAASPWLGINALDGLITAYNTLSVLRQQTMPGDIIQGHITDGGAAPNIIHGHAAGVFVVRARTQARLRELKPKVDACFEAGAKATGAKLDTEPAEAYADHVPNRVLGRIYTKYWNELDPPNRISEDQDIDEIRGRTSASTDQGDMSYAMPSLSPSFAIRAANGPHSRAFEAAAGRKEAFERALRVGKALAGTALEVLGSRELLEKIKAQWKEDMALPSEF